MSDNDTQATAENHFVEAANGVTYAYRRFGTTTVASPPLVFLHRFRETLDDWDLLLVDTLAESREVVLLDNAGVGLSSGIVPRSVTAMARDAIAFLDALGLTEIDLLGYSLGGFVAQELTLLRPQLVRRLVLAATGPQGGGEHMHGWISDVEAIANTFPGGPDELLWLFLSPSESSMQKGREYLQRMSARQRGRDRDNGPEVIRAQYDVIVEQGIPDPSKLARLAGITQPTLVANGDNDTMTPTVNTHILSRYLPNARVRIYVDAGHGFLFQFPTEFAAIVARFLA